MNEPSAPPDDPRPAHHIPGGGFRSPWLAPREDEMGGFPFLRWMWERWRAGGPPKVDPSKIPVAIPDPARPRLTENRIRVTWIGHSTWLIQSAGVNLLTDPVFGDRVSPLPIGPMRHLPPALSLKELPPIDVVLLSHDHYDHLDRFTVRRLREVQGDTVTWCTPLGYRDWFRDQGVSRVLELDWWRSGEIEMCRDRAGAGDLGPAPQTIREKDQRDSDPVSLLRITCAPAQHWTRRGRTANTRLWGSFRVQIPRLIGDGESAGGEDPISIYFGGDSGYFPGYNEIGERLGPFDLTLMPIGAYEPRWFMRRSHMNPEEAVKAFEDMGATGHLAAMHWGTFRLTDEPPLEPPVRTRAAWVGSGLDPGRLHIPAIGETFEI